MSKFAESHDISDIKDLRISTLYKKVCSSFLTLREKCPNTEFFLGRIQSECGKMQTRKNSVFGHSSRSADKSNFWYFPEVSRTKAMTFWKCPKILKIGKYNYNKVSINKNICPTLSLEYNLPTNNKRNEEILEKICPKMSRNGVKTERIYIKLYMSIFIRKNFSHPPKVFLSETLYFELAKNLVICFMRTLASLLLDTANTQKIWKVVIK